MNLAEQLRHRGLTVVEYEGWQDRGRTGRFTPSGVMCHHTGPYSTVTGMVTLCENGYATLPGPLCQVILDPDGACHVIAGKRCNHAGVGSYRNILDGNRYFYGIEAMHPGAKGVPWPAGQRGAYVRAAAAILEMVGRDQGMCIAHREWATPPGRKVDPTGINMTSFRLEVAALLAEWARPGPLMEVPPRMNVPISGTVVDVLKAPTGGVWMLTDIGAIYAWFCEDKGAPARHPDYWGDRRAAQLEPLGDGYRVIASTGEFYEYP